jgi:flagellar biosynthesis/type III secretory pathway M-ring protein FliF/YscJ
MIDEEQKPEVVETKESIWPKIWKFIKEAWEWIVAVLVIVTGWFLIQRWLNKPTKPEQELLDDIEQHEQAVNQLQGQVQSNLQHEQQLEQQQQQVDQQIDQIYNDYDQHQQQFQQHEQQIIQETSDHQANLDYINQKYKKKSK